MILALKVFCLMLTALFLPAMLVSGFRGTGIKEGNVVFVAIGVVGFITLQWLL